ncbi:hypothetical protein E1B28_004973 [Marasmius oreades]|uniref:D-isomer specific 2-hydroxyacid dehydrogenase NAD-binding domain-containing protein n=1 Tax=Marasmius oreades TaxID=181124 RepID=A0A9P7UZN2_9AGAR|nr:uncharacterized protein E1B28_004973 [Marasmius oreades]KAG7097641.1 hypothetical protein E1B28_004973 [Marasmius oreades]
MITDIVNEEFLEAAGPNLWAVSTTSVGYEHVYLKQIAKRGLRLGHPLAVLTDAVADISIMLALMAGRNMNETMAIVREGQWPKFTWSPFAMCGPQISTTAQSPSRTILFLGFGRISQATLSRAVSFGVTDCVYHSNPSSPPKLERDQAILKQHQPQLKSLRSVDLDTLARESDVVTVLAPGGEKMKHAVLVNAARGTLVDSGRVGEDVEREMDLGSRVGCV